MRSVLDEQARSVVALSEAMMGLWLGQVQTQMVKTREWLSGESRPPSA
jgi:hypothetical protein